MLALNAIGVTVVYGTVRTLNLAHGDVFALSSVLVTTVITSLGIQPTWPPALRLGILAALLAAAMMFGAILNVAIEQAAFKPFRGRSRLAPLIATLGISFMLYQAALFWRTTLPSWVPGDHRSVPGLPEVPIDRIPDLLPNVDLVQALGLPLQVTFRFNDLFVLLVAGVFALGVSVFMQRTATGRAIRACAQNPELAQICGVNLDGTIRRAFAFGGALAGAAAFVFALYYSRPFGNHGAQSGLIAFTAAMLGGIGSPTGALVSGLTLGISGAFSDYFLAAQWTPVLLQALLIGLLILRPTGLSAGGQAEVMTTTRDAAILTPSSQRTRFSRWMWGLIILAAAFPLLSGIHLQILATGIGILILLALGLNLSLGLAGVLDLGYAVSFGIGGYATALLTNRWSKLGGLLPQRMEFFFIVLVSVALAGLFGIFKGRLAGRLRDDYLVVVMLALGLLARQVVVNLNDFTGGTGGVAALPPPHIFTYPLTQPTAQYYLVFGLVALVAFLSQRLIHSRIGLGWLSGSEDEIAAESSGVDVARSRLVVLTLSSAAAGVAGTLYASTFAYFAPDLMAFHVSTMVLAMVILGGAGSVPGAILGAVIIAGYDRLAIPRLGELMAQFQLGGRHVAPDIRGVSDFTFGLVLYLTVLLRARRRN